MRVLNGVASLGAGGLPPHPLTNIAQFGAKSSSFREGARFGSCILFLKMVGLDEPAVIITPKQDYTVNH